MSKLIVYLLLFCSSSLMTIAQTYSPYPENEGSWVVTTVSWNGEERDYIDWFGDTVINNVHYLKRYLNGTYNGGIRQNLISQETFIIDNNNIEFDISYIYQANIGDTLFLEESVIDFVYHYGYGEDSVIVLDIDSVETNLDYRKIFHWGVLINGEIYSDSYYTEGIGSSGIMELNYGRYFECHYNEQNLVIGDPINPFCSSLSMNELESISIEVYPNPSTNQVSIVSDQPIDILKVIDPNGRVIKEIAGNGFESNVHLDGLSNGVYLIKVISNNFETVTKRIVKN